MTKPLEVTQRLTHIPNPPKRNGAPGTEHPITHVDQRLVAAAVEITQPRQSGKSLFQEVGQLLNAGEDILRAIQNGVLFSTEEAAIAECVRACDALEKSIANLREMGC